MPSESTTVLSNCKAVVTGVLVTVSVTVSSPVILPVLSATSLKPSALVSDTTYVAPAKMSLTVTLSLPLRYTLNGPS